MQRPLEPVVLFAAVEPELEAVLGLAAVAVELVVVVGLVVAVAVVGHFVDRKAVAMLVED